MTAIKIQVLRAPEAPENTTTGNERPLQQRTRLPPWAMGHLTVDQILGATALTHGEKFENLIDYHNHVVMTLKPYGAFEEALVRNYIYWNWTAARLTRFRAELLGWFTADGLRSLLTGILPEAKLVEMVTGYRRNDAGGRASCGVALASVGFRLEDAEALGQVAHRSEFAFLNREIAAREGQARQTLGRLEQGRRSRLRAETARQLQTRASARRSMEQHRRDQVAEAKAIVIGSRFDVRHSGERLASDGQKRHAARMSAARLAAASEATTSASRRPDPQDTERLGERATRDPGVGAAGFREHSFGWEIDFSSNDFPNVFGPPPAGVGFVDADVDYLQDLAVFSARCGNVVESDQVRTFTSWTLEAERLRRSEYTRLRGYMIPELRKVLLALTPSDEVDRLLRAWPHQKAAKEVEILLAGCGYSMQTVEALTFVKYRQGFADVRLQIQDADANAWSGIKALDWKRLEFELRSLQAADPESVHYGKRADWALQDEHREWLAKANERVRVSRLDEGAKGDKRQ